MFHWGKLGKFFIWHFKKDFFVLHFLVIQTNSLTAIYQIFFNGGIAFVNEAV